jgi:gamma-glutamylcyclotransferase (GGCT)/AIG2-like uncharacterized protein YtfP
VNDLLNSESAFPLFAYGTLKQKEIAFDHIENLVDKVIEAKLDGYEIGIRDSLPVIFEDSRSSVKGELLFPKEGKSQEFWEVVNEFEGTNLYTQKQLEVRGEFNQIHKCLTFVGKREKARGYSKLDGDSWTSKYDPYLAYSFPLLLKEINRINKESYPADMYNEYWQYMNALQEKYLLLTVILEHIALLVIGTYDSTGPNARINLLGKTSAWNLAYKKIKENPGITRINIKDAKKLKYNYGNENAEDAISTYYQVRSNLSHQGKSGGFADCDLMYACLKDLSLILKEYLKLKIVGIESQWERQEHNNL